MRIGYDRNNIASYGEKYGAIIVASGKEHIGQLLVDGRPTIEGLVETIKSSGIDKLSIIDDHKEDLSSDLPREGYFIIPVDYPLISVNILRRMMDALDKIGTGKIAVPAFEGKKGMPLYAPLSKVSAILDEDNEEEPIKIPVNEEGCLLSSYGKEGYEDIKAFVAKGFKREKIELLTARKRIILALEDSTAVKDIVEAITEDIQAELLGMDKFGKEHMPAIERIYCQNSDKAKRTAEALCQVVNDRLDSSMSKQVIEYRTVEGFGPKEEGEDIYDLQYRAMRAFAELLRFDDAKDIILIACEEVLRAIDTNVAGLRIDDNWEPIEVQEFRMQEPFPLPVSEKTADEDKPMNIHDMTMEDILKYYE